MAYSLQNGLNSEASTHLTTGDDIFLLVLSFLFDAGFNCRDRVFHAYARYEFHH